MILPDQRPGGKKGFYRGQFFGFDAPTTTLVHNLCTRWNATFLSRRLPQHTAGEFSLRISPLEHARLAAMKTAAHST